MRGVAKIIIIQMATNMKKMPSFNTNKETNEIILKKKRRGRNNVIHWQRMYATTRENLLLEEKL